MYATKDVVMMDCILLQVHCSLYTFAPGVEITSTSYKASTDVAKTARGGKLLVVRPSPKSFSSSRVPGIKTSNSILGIATARKAV